MAATNGPSADGATSLSTDPGPSAPALSSPLVGFDRPPPAPPWPPRRRPSLGGAGTCRCDTRVVTRGREALRARHNSAGRGGRGPRWGVGPRARPTRRPWGSSTRWAARAAEPQAPHPPPAPRPAPPPFRPRAPCPPPTLRGLARAQGAPGFLTCTQTLPLQLGCGRGPGLLTPAGAGGAGHGSLGGAPGKREVGAPRRAADG